MPDRTPATVGPLAAAMAASMAERLSMHVHSKVVLDDTTGLITTLENISIPIPWPEPSHTHLELLDIDGHIRIYQNADPGLHHIVANLVTGAGPSREHVGTMILEEGPGVTRVRNCLTGSVGTLLGRHAATGGGHPHSYALAQASGLTLEVSFDGNTPAFAHEPVKITIVLTLIYCLGSPSSYTYNTPGSATVQAVLLRNTGNKAKVLLVEENGFLRLAEINVNTGAVTYTPVPPA